MKSSTIRRSTLSKESMDVIEVLAQERTDNEDIDEYLNEVEEIQQEVDETYNKAKEIDLLWQNFKNNQLNTKSPTAYVTMGFIAGIIFSMLCAWTVGSYLMKTGRMSLSRSGIYRASVQQQAEEELIEPEQKQAEQEVVPEQTVQEPEQNVQPEEAPTKVEAQKVETPKVDTSKMKKYVVKNGDTGESIIKKFYGAYTPERADKVIKANNLKNLDRINIDQELLIPVE